MANWKSYLNRRKNPFSANPTVTDIEPGSSIGTTHFSSVLSARSFLKETSCLPESQKRSAEIQAKIADAQNTIRKADLRNTRRQIRRYEKKNEGVPAKLIARYKALRATTCEDSDALMQSACGDMRNSRQISEECEEVVKIRNRGCEKKVPIRRVKPTKVFSGPIDLSGVSKKPIARWEEVVGPDGEIVRFKLLYNKDGSFQKRVRSKEAPQKGDIVLDLTQGFKAWLITKSRRRPYHEITPEMRKSYENSFLYKVRQLAAGQLSLPKFLETIKNSPEQGWKKSKKLKKRNR